MHQIVPIEKDASEILARGSAAIRRYHELPRWRMVARRNAWRRFQSLTKLAQRQTAGSRL